MTKVRDAFADEQSYITFMRHLAEMERRERLQAAQAQQKRPRRKGERLLLTRSQLALKRMKNREKSRRWRAANPEKYRAIARESRRRRFARNPELYRENNRRWRKRDTDQARLRYRVYYYDHHEEKLAYRLRYVDAHREEIQAYKRQYYQAHREEIQACNRQYYQAHKERLKAADHARYAARNPGCVSLDERIARARAFDKQVVELRAAGLTFREIGERLGHSIGSCKNTYRRAMKRQQAQCEKKTA